MRIVESQKGEIARLKKLCANAGIDTTPPAQREKTAIPPNGINEPFYGVYLGEKLDTLRKRLKVSKTKYVFVDDKCPAKVWSVRSKEPKVKNILVCTFNEQIYEIDVEFKNASDADCRAMELQLEKDYPAIYRDRYEKLLGRNTFETTIDGVSIGIILNYDTAAEKNSRLKLTYVHIPLLDQMRTEQEK